MDHDLYEGIAQRYDRFFGQVGKHEPAVVDFYRRLFQENGVHSVLDCACGTGHHLLLFHSLGCEVVGSDISESMLVQAQQNLERHGADVPLKKVDYRELPQHVRRQFDAVVCLSTAIAHMPDETEMLRALRSMRDVLRDGGILVLTQGTSDRQWREKPRFFLVVNARDFSRLFAIDYHGRGATYNVLDVFHGEGEDDLKVWSVDYPWMPLRDDYQRLIEAAGFASVEFYGTYGFDPYDTSTSARIIAVARA